MSVSPSGGKVLSITYEANPVIDLFDFDRCTGDLNNWIQVHQPSGNWFWGYLGSSFSPKEKYFYVSTLDTLYQYDLSATNIFNSSTSIFVNPLILPTRNGEIGFHQLGPDNKIYIAFSYRTYYPNNDYDSLNMHLSVINEPDSGGLSCNFSPFSFYLGGRRCFTGLPNMPNYNLGALQGSMCDSLSDTNELPSFQYTLSAYPNPSKEKFYLYFSDIREQIKSLTVTDILGNEVYNTTANISEINLSAQAAGIYFSKAITKSGRTYVVKLVRE